MVRSKREEEGILITQSHYLSLDSLEWKRGGKKEKRRLVKIIKMNIKIGSIAKGADNAAGGTFPHGQLEESSARDDARTMNAIEKRKECAFLYPKSPFPRN